MLLVIALSTGCALTEEPAGVPHKDVTIQVEAPAGTRAEQASPDVCALAKGLPTSNVCSLICDVDALKAALEAEGGAPGRCYDLACPMPDHTMVYVGVCIDQEQTRAAPPTASRQVE
jgi:hypothetical protein